MVEGYQHHDKLYKRSFVQHGLKETFQGSSCSDRRSLDSMGAVCHSVVAGILILLNG